MAAILTDLKNKYIAKNGFHTDRHLLVIESDDWGSIRMPSIQTFIKLQESGDHPEKDGFLSNDSLETEKDIMALYDVLTSVCDKNGNPAVITANFVTANPNFDKIDISTRKYAYEPFWETYRKYGISADMLKLFKNGINNNVFIPQLHCREHLNVNRWMNALHNGQSDALLAFENQMIGVFSSFSETNKYGYMDAFNTDQTSIAELSTILCDAIKLFNGAFGYQSKTFVASCFVWAKEFEKVLFENGILGIQSAPWQNCSIEKNGHYKLKRKIHYTGQKNRYGQIYTVRNCGYEPAYYQNADDCVESCFTAICHSFDNKKPAIINSHRFNYIGTINPKNAENNLIGLRNLLMKIKKRYSDVEFVSSSDLMEIIVQEEK